MLEQLEEVPNMWTAEQIVDLPVPKVVEELSSRNTVQQPFQEQSVGQERISECGVEQVVPVPARQIEVSQCLGDTGESLVFRRSFFWMYTGMDSPSMSWKGRCCSFRRTQFLLGVESLGRQ